MKKPARAYFTSREEARKGALAINDKLKATFAFYRRLAGRIWTVESTCMTHDDFVKILATSGCNYTLEPPEPPRKP
jgi:hypothetical protein